MSNRLFRIIFNFYGSSGNLQFDTMGELRLSPFRSIRQLIWGERYEPPLTVMAFLSWPSPVCKATNFINIADKIDFS